MIGKLKGTLSELRSGGGLVETAGGVFYEVFLSPQLLSKYHVGQPIEVYTYFQVRDDAHVLFGFQTREEYDFFKLLLSVPSVGPKTAYLVISYATIEELVTAVKTNDAGYFTKIPGLGKKTAMKIILELSQKLKSEFQMDRMHLSEDDKTVIEALMALGYKSQEAKTILTKVPKDLTVEEKIQFALRLTVNHKKEV